MKPIESRTLAKSSIFLPAEAPIDSGKIISQLTGLVNFWRPASPVHRVFFALVQPMLVRCFLLDPLFSVSKKRNSPEEFTGLQSVKIQ